ncbi:MAG: type I-E CRISPR-associated protein Cas5/CasD [Lamprocystis purpurea]|jgi:CRISPR system Cascade subunit CasD|uniref:type I-E CRISPR-associated protein Cas5/CasD n=1 Tax=Lamprocystis purpurea TaxID=61598 RepID=UPI00037E1A5D|nr:type I-E CRISPR-associated protein Cas5/CasD [Lamprocystis purpurea]MBV5272585.1 type I-E CRISPR-associated protein Cas5/CasD [Lamprocystis purpurea]
MAAFLILRLDGPMQAWGTHTFEDYRPVNLFPTRSGLLGLLGACLGLDRRDHASLTALAESVTFAVRADAAAPRPDGDPPVTKPALKLADFHTVLDARKVDGSANKNPVVSSREYLFDAAFTVAVGTRAEASFGLERIAEALRRPRFTPVLGRRSCPIARPLLEHAEPIEATDALAALAQVPPVGGVIYSEGKVDGDHDMPIRDVPSYGRIRQFGTRRVYRIVDQGTGEGT